MDVLSVFTAVRDYSDLTSFFNAAKCFFIVAPCFLSVAPETMSTKRRHLIVLFCRVTMVHEVQVLINAVIKYNQA